MVERRRRVIRSGPARDGDAAVLDGRGAGGNLYPDELVHRQVADGRLYV